MRRLQAQEVGLWRVYADVFEMAMSSSMRMQTGSDGEVVALSGRYRPEPELR